jgi:hypothetical protein
VWNSLFSYAFCVRITLWVCISKNKLNELLRNSEPYCGLYIVIGCRHAEWEIMLQLGCCARKKNVGDIHWLPVTDKSGFLHSNWPARCTGCTCIVDTRFIHRPDRGMRERLTVVQWLLLVRYDMLPQAVRCVASSRLSICKQQWVKGVLKCNFRCGNGRSGDWLRSSWSRGIKFRRVWGCFVLFNVENVNLRVRKWNKSVSNRFCNVSDRS